jgi:hypothetical protein
MYKSLWRKITLLQQNTLRSNALISNNYTAQAVTKKQELLAANKMSTLPCNDCKKDLVKGIKYN